MDTPPGIVKVTPAEYLRRERLATYRSEFFQGEIFAMSGGSIRHSRIKSNLMGTLWGRLRGRPCSAYDSDLRIKCPTGLYTYPDVSVICGVPECDDQLNDTVLNPTLLIEVLSKSTEGYDRGKKFDHYSTIPTFREYVLIYQDEPTVRRYLRNEDGMWVIMNPVSGLDQTVTLDSIDIEIPLAEIFEQVDFTADDINAE